MGSPEFPLPISDPDEENRGEDIDPRHFYAAYVYEVDEDSGGRQSDITAIIETARDLGYPVRYWWLSEAVDLQGFPDRLIVCVHHPSSAEDAGMDVYQALKEKEVVWDDLEAASVYEYQLLGKPINNPGSILEPDGTLLFPELDPALITWSNPHKGIDFRLWIDDSRMEKLSPAARQRLQITLARLANIVTSLLNNEDAVGESEEELGLFGFLAEQMDAISPFFEMMSEDKPDWAKTDFEDEQNFPFLPAEDESAYSLQPTPPSYERPLDQPSTEAEGNFAAWMEQVDQMVWKRAGCSVYDLPDCDYRNMWRDDLPPEEAVRVALTEAGFNEFE